MNPDYYSAPPQPNQRRSIVKLVVLGVAFLAIIFGVFWLSGHAYLTISVDSSSTKPLTYTFVNQKTLVSTTVKSNNHKLKKLLPRGNYQVLADQDNENLFVIGSVGGFLTNKTVHGGLTAERSRSFVGDNPGTCMAYLGVLASYDCAGSFANLSVHRPSTTNTPTYLFKPNPSIPGNVEGIISTSEGMLALVQDPFGGGESAGSQKIYKLGADLTVVDSQVLGKISPASFHDIKPYKEGFLVYDTEFSNAYYYSSMKSSPQKITLGVSPGVVADPYSVTTSGNTLVLAYPNNLPPKPGAKESPSSEARLGKPLTHIIIGDGSKFKVVTINKNFTQLVACGTQLLCGLGNNQFSVYQVSGTKTKLLYSIANVKSMDRLGKTMLLSVGSNIINFDVDTRQGYSSYTLGDYSFCGLQPAGNNYVVCVSSGGRRSALYVDQSTANSDSIDKKILTIRKEPSLQNLTIYGHIIFVTPATGDLVYSATDRTFEFDPATLKIANQNIAHAITAAGVDTSVYTIKNTTSNL